MSASSFERRAAQHQETEFSLGEYLDKDQQALARETKQLEKEISDLELRFLRGNKALCELEVEEEIW